MHRRLHKILNTIYRTPVLSGCAVGLRERGVSKVLRHGHEAGSSPARIAVVIESVVASGVALKFDTKVWADASGGSLAGTFNPTVISKAMLTPELTGAGLVSGVTIGGLVAPPSEIAAHGIGGELATFLLVTHWSGMITARAGSILGAMGMGAAQGVTGPQALEHWSREPSRRYSLLAAEAILAGSGLDGFGPANRALWKAITGSKKGLAKKLTAESIRNMGHARGAKAIEETLDDMLSERGRDAATMAAIRAAIAEAENAPVKKAAKAVAVGKAQSAVRIVSEQMLRTFHANLMAALGTMGGSSAGQSPGRMDGTPWDFTTIVVNVIEEG
jgi:hypothetical protein